ncbi:unnamed protein product [Brassica rapa]|uniref:Uncharacterized protein n=1 Tax=Brassica campestris TaxID=3711 RepID=A0A3P5ZRU4_BRACM|nr:unnamed protein product [Brassica rapa]VDC75080.1 unnamed protein product [Brassica rapa]
MSISRFALFCIVLVFIGSFHEVDARPPYCYRAKNSNWCCTLKPKGCRGSKVECDEICKP